MKKNYSNYHTILLTIILLLVNILRDKSILIATGLTVSINTLLYPLTFLLLIIIFKKYNLKTAKDAILTSSLTVILFYIIISILTSINGNIDSESFDNLLKLTFTPNYFSLYNIKIFYPKLLPLLGSTIIYIITHYIMLLTFEALEDNSNYFIAFILSIFISYTLDQMLFIPTINIVDMYYGIISYVDLIKELTANFLIMIMTSLIMIFSFPLCIKKKN